MRETSEGTSYKMVPLVFRHFAATSIRVLPDFAPLSLFVTVFRVLLTLLLFLAQTTRKITVDCKCMCARVYMCEWKTLKTPRKNQRNAYGMGVLCGVRKFKKKKQWENRSKHGLLFSGTIWPSMGQKKPKTVIFTTHYFCVSTGICRRFRPKVLSQTRPNKALFCPKS